MSRAKRKGRPRKKRNVSLAAMPYNGDHGTGTQAANAGTQVEAITDEQSRNPNHMARRKRIEVIDTLTSLTMRQTQAAKKIRDAYCRNEMLSSGGALKERVQSSPKPDATVDVQCAAMSELVLAMSAVPIPARPLIEGVCWHNLEVGLISRRLGIRRPHAILKATLDLVADRLRY